MKHLDLFSGIGGFALAARNVGWQTVAFCEPEPFCQAVLRKHWPDVPIHPDVRELQADAVGPVDIITGGYPCQPFSSAGKRRGKDDDRHLWPSFARLVLELRPRWVVGENVVGHIAMGVDDVLADLERFGYACEAFVIPACAVDAPHRRERIWIVAHTTSIGLEDEQKSSDGARQSFGALDRAGDRTAGGSAAPRDSKPGRGSGLVGATMADADREGELQPQGRELQEWRRSSDGCRWSAEPGVGRVADGIPGRMDRLAGLGNAIVPQVAEEIFRAIAATSSGGRSE